MKLLEDVSHCLIPNFSEEFLDDIQTQVVVELPYPIHRPFKYIEDDVIADFQRESEHYSNQLLGLHKDFHLVRERIMNQSFDHSHGRITQGLLNVCKSGKCGIPFLCDYNPYYMSGFLGYFCLNGASYLVRPDCKNNLRITNIEKPWKSGKINLETRLKENVHGIRTLCNDYDISLLLQHETQVNLVHTSNISESAEIRWNKKFKQNILDSKCTKTQLGIALANGKLKLYDIETKMKTNLDPHSAIHLEFIDENTISLLNRNSLKILDQRSVNYKTFQPELNTCDKLCSVKFDDNLIYVVSRHHVLRTDLRFFKTVDFCTHLMKSSPCYVDLTENDGKKFICLSSQKVNEKVLFTGNPISSLPLKISSIQDSLKKCRLMKDVLLMSGLEDRLCKSTGGIKLVSDNKDVFLYTVNSLGDIFKQKISENFDSELSDPIHSLYYWINKLPESSEVLCLNNVADLSDARFALNNRIYDERLKKFAKKSKKATLFLNHFNIIYKNNLCDLAGNFVSIWREEEEREQVDLVPEVAPIEKVSSWIESNYFVE